MKRSPEPSWHPHDVLIQTIARRVQHSHVVDLLKLISRAGSRRGGPLGVVPSLFPSNLYRNDTDQMPERVEAVARQVGFAYVDYARSADVSVE